MNTLRWLWNASRGHRLPLLGSVAVGTLYVGVSLFFVYVCKLLIDGVTSQPADDLRLLVGLFVGCMVMQLLLSVIRSRLVGHTEIRMRNALRQRLFNHLMESRDSGSGALHTGDMLNRIEEDVTTVTDFLCRSMPAFLVTSVQLAGALFFLLSLDVRLAGVLLFVMPVALLFSKTYMHRMRRLSREIRDTDSRVQSHLQEHLQHRVLMRTLEYTPRAEALLEHLQRLLQTKVGQRIDFSAFSRSMVQLGFATGYAVAFLWGIFGLLDGTVTFGMMTAFLQLVSQVQRPMVELSRQIPSFTRVLTSAERLQELTAQPLEEQGEPVRLNGPVGVRIDRLTFAYPGGNRPVFDGFSHDFKPGSLTAVVGETGVGKSTLIRLMLALHKPGGGSITLYDGDREAAASPLTRCNFAYVPQGNTLVSGTIRENLLMGCPDATDEELHAALHTATADFVGTLPDGLDTRCGEQGAGLSEGQAQRIAIARGLLRPGGILLLDEPTSSVDSETERLMLGRLSTQVQGKTLILVTHRETIARLCTEVVTIGRR